jgi:iron(III) transport system permease protein
MTPPRRFAGSDRGAARFAPLVATLIGVPMLSVAASLALPANTALPLGAFGQYILQSLFLAGLALGVALIFGVSSAWIIARYAFFGRRLIGALMILPLAVPAYILAYFYADLLDFAGPVQSALRAVTGWQAGDYAFVPLRSLPGAGFILGTALFPYIHLLARAAFETEGASAYLAARSLGAGPATAFMRVSLPQARPAIVAGSALVIMETLADFGVSDYFALSTFSTGIFSFWLGQGDRILALRLAAVLLLFVLALVYLERRSRGGRGYTPSRQSGLPARSDLSAGPAVLAMIGCLIPLSLGFLIPVGGLLANALSSTAVLALPAEAFVNSLSLSAVVAVIATGIAWYLAAAMRGKPSLITRSSIAVSTLGYALPGALLAVGLLMPLGAVDRSMTTFLRDQFGWTGGLILTGTIATLVYACVVRFLTVGYQSLQSGYQRIPLVLDLAARSLGATPERVASAIHRPLLLRALLVSALFIGVDTLRELPATLILRPFNFETLATRLYWYASDERFSEASVIALALIGLGFIPFLLLAFWPEEQNAKAGSSRRTRV